MILEELKKIKTEKRNLRQFVVLCFLVLVGLGVGKIYHGHADGYFFGGLGLALGVVGWIWPFLFKIFYLVWMGFAIVLGNIVSRVVLILTFYAVITPLGLIFKLFGKTFVKSKAAATYWVAREDYSSKPERYEQQF